MEVVNLTLPIPPSDNRRLTISYSGGLPPRMVLTKEARDYKRTVPLIAKSYWKKRAILVPSNSHQLHITAKAFVPNWRGDCSNFTKMLKDVLIGIVYDDDKFVHLNYEDSEKDSDDPRITLCIPVDPFSEAVQGTKLPEYIVEHREAKIIHQEDGRLLYRLDYTLRTLGKNPERKTACTCRGEDLIELGWSEESISHAATCPLAQTS